MIRLLADKSEQFAHGVRRTTAAIENIVEDGMVIHQAGAPFYERLESLRAGRSIIVRTVVSTD